MVTASWLRRRHRLSTFILPALLFSFATKAELFATASSPAIQDGLINKAPTVCPIAQDGYTSNTFPWTHNPTCIDVVLLNEVVYEDEDESPDINKTFCAYTNRNYNNNRGISFVVTPEVAASITAETFGMGIGGLDGMLGEEMGTWEVKAAGTKGKGMFAKKDVAGIFAGESVVIKTPVLFVDRTVLEVPSASRRQLLMGKAVEQLPEETKGPVEKLDFNIDGTWEDIVMTNGVGVKWPWVDDVPELLAIIPEVARINHACRPNTLWRFDDSTLSFEIFALKDIKPGEEITRSYGFERRARRRRMGSLRDNFGFICECPLCTGTDEEIMASNDRLSEIKALKSVLPENEEDTPQLLGMLPNLIQQLEEEDLLAELPMYEEILAYTWSSFGIEDRAKHWAGRAQKHWAVVAGKDSWEQRRVGELEKDVRGHSTWMTWKGDPWEDVGKGHPWDERKGDHDHVH